MRPRSKKEFIGYLHGFRGIAILAIMGAHAWSMLGEQAWSGMDAQSGVQVSGLAFRLLYATTEGIFHGTTLFFALISGILVTRVLRGMPWVRFYRNKFSNVVLPYLVVSTALTLIIWPEISAYLKAHDLHDSFLQVLLYNFVTGQAELQLWYIPVLAVLYVMTPLLVAMLRFRNGILLLLLALVPLIVSRTVAPLLSLQSIVYFLGAYAFGMYLGERLDLMLAFVRKFRFGLMAVFSLSLVVNFLLFFWDYTPGGFVSLQQTVVYANKLSAALLVLGYLHAHEERMPRILQTLGTYAFSLYFLHFTVMVALDKTLVLALPDMSVAAVAVGGVAVYIVGISVTLLLCVLLKKLLGRYSRMVIGA